MKEGGSSDRSVNLTSRFPPVRGDRKERGKRCGGGGDRKVVGSEKEAELNNNKLRGKEKGIRETPTVVQYK